MVKEVPPSPVTSRRRRLHMSGHRHHDRLPSRRSRASITPGEHMALHLVQDGVVVDGWSRPGQQQQQPDGGGSGAQEEVTTRSGPSNPFPFGSRKVYNKEGQFSLLRSFLLKWIIIRAVVCRT